MDCFHDFCLACDRESTSGPYCSQACKLADLERSTPATPLTISSPRSSWASSSSSPGYVLPPAYDFSNRSSIYSDPASSLERQPPSYFMRLSPRPASDDSVSTLPRLLSPSASRSSLSSTSSEGVPSPTGLSQQAKVELQGYFNSFSKVRSSQRRASLK
ncbi:Hypothetical protein R9X50_00383400 [Acrodontium crateriforme]|uniref:Uncharacterized protein n=1 Tax=Acrodontium crateriforme TaxID=150365 RepID=A0AAQ3M465_9PEZI|nr:Hypothetical protein R9X50_00383400 [Acrodontium crateriforme]